MITLQELDTTKDEVKRHFQYVWPLVEAGREDAAVLEVANDYLGQVRKHSLIQYRVVIRMIEQACGLSWAAITGDTTTQAGRV